MGFSLRRKSSGKSSSGEYSKVAGSPFSSRSPTPLNQSNGKERLSPEQLLNYVPEFEVDNLLGANTKDDEANIKKAALGSAWHDMACKDLPGYPKYPRPLRLNHQEWKRSRYDFADDIVENSRGNLRNYDVLHSTPYAAVRQAGGAIGSVSSTSQTTTSYGIAPQNRDVIFDADDHLNAIDEAPVIELSATAVAKQFERLSAVDDIESTTRSSPSSKTGISN
jgi:hypothetical protein